MRSHSPAHLTAARHHSKPHSTFHKPRTRQPPPHPARYNHLNPDIKRDAWTLEEDQIIIREHLELGNKWAKIDPCIGKLTEENGD